jgi:hypothetical protein
MGTDSGESLSREQVELLVKLAGDLHGEATRCADTRCWRAASLLIGSAVEAAILATACCLEAELRATDLWPKAKGPPQGWEFWLLVDVAKRARWLPSEGPHRGNLFESLNGEVGDAVLFVQHVRNMAAHPGRYVREPLRPDFDDLEHMEYTYEVIAGIAATVFERLSAVIDSPASGANVSHVAEPGSSSKSAPRERPL